MQIEKDVERVLEHLRGDHFVTLQLPRRSATRGLLPSAKEVKKAFHRLARLYHPDKNLDADTSCLYGVIRSAYDCLSSPGPLYTAVTPATA